MEVHGATLLVLWPIELVIDIGEPVTLGLLKLAKQMVRRIATVMNRFGNTGDRLEANSFGDGNR